MRALLWFLLFGSFSCVIGCSEIVRPVEQSTSTTIDVVGEPSDPTSDSTSISDILGSAAVLSEDADAVAETKLNSSNSTENLEEPSSSIEGANEPDVVGSQGTDKTDPLKTSQRNTHQAK